jgi:DNA-binding XRE family transcriptional regulator
MRSSTLPNVTALPNATAGPAFEVFDRADDTAEFGAFLRMLRQRIPPHTATLGSWRRLPVRRGRPVTQEEIAEAVGVSRNWYRRLESGAGVRASMKLLNRLANTVVFTPEERTTLFVLAIPEMAYMRSR